MRILLRMTSNPRIKPSLTSRAVFLTKTPMSNETAAPQSLTEWAQSHFTAFFEHNTTSASNDAQDDPTPDQSPSLDSQIQAMFSPNAQIFMNHTGPLSVGDFTKQMGQAFGTNQTSVEWKESFEVDDQAQDKTEEGKTGIFAGYLIVTRTLKFRIRAAPAKNYTTISLSAK
ncbi:hypothetical protein BDP27DRAFT_1313017, partial [Rhodocollybia butyracea]